MSIEPGETVEVTLERANDSVPRLRITTAAGSVNRYTLHQYLGSGTRTVIKVEFADGRLLSARVRSGPEFTFSDLRWTSDGRPPDSLRVTALRGPGWLGASPCRLSPGASAPVISY